MTSKIKPDSIVFVLEMNNDENKIMGIGLVRNHSVYGKYSAYENAKYNRFMYVGKTRIDVDEMNTEEREIVRLMEELCFKGNTHVKRGQGITSFPLKLLYMCSKYIDLTVYVKNMFKKRME
jgi:hypothetical protein